MYLVCIEDEIKIGPGPLGKYNYTGKGYLIDKMQPEDYKFAPFGQYDLILIELFDDSLLGEGDGFFYDFTQGNFCGKFTIKEIYDKFPSKYIRPLEIKELEQETKTICSDGIGIGYGRNFVNMYDGAKFLGKSNNYIVSRDNCLINAHDSNLIFSYNANITARNHNVIISSGGTIECGSYNLIIGEDCEVRGHGNNLIFLENGKAYLGEENYFYGKFGSYFLIEYVKNTYFNNKSFVIGINGLEENEIYSFNDIEDKLEKGISGDDLMFSNLLITKDDIRTTYSLPGNLLKNFEKLLDERYKDDEKYKELLGILKEETNGEEY